MSDWSPGRVSPTSGIGSYASTRSREKLTDSPEGTCPSSNPVSIGSLHPIWRGGDYRFLPTLQLPSPRRMSYSLRWGRPHAGEMDMRISAIFLRRRVKLQRRFRDLP